MNALVTIEAAPTAGPHGEGHTIFGPKSQAEFLQNLQLFGNVRLACRAARISAQTAYRQRRASPALAQAWDAALLAARDHAEQVLADRAVNGWEEAVFYHGEEVARRRRYSDRLLLAHLARLDRMAEREELAETLAVLDGVIETLRGGEADVAAALRQAERGREEALDAEKQAQAKKPKDRVPSVPPCRICGGKCADPDAELGKKDCEWMGNRLKRMDISRPLDAPPLHKLAGGDMARTGLVEAWQLEAFEAEVEEWWLIDSEKALSHALQSFTHEA